VRNKLELINRRGLKIIYDIDSGDIASILQCDCEVDIAKSSIIRVVQAARYTVSHWYQREP